MGLVSSLLVNFVETPLPLVVLIVLALTTIACAVVVRRNEYVRPLITQGWTPLFGAMVISTATGIILDLFVSRYSGFALLAVIISGEELWRMYLCLLILTIPDQVYLVLLALFSFQEFPQLFMPQNLRVLLDQLSRL